MKNFYINYFENEKLAPLVREISWTKNVVILEKCKDDLEREFYIYRKNRTIWRVKNNNGKEYFWKYFS